MRKKKLISDTLITTSKSQTTLRNELVDRILKEFEFYAFLVAELELNKEDDFNELKESLLEITEKYTIAPVA